MKSQHKTPHHRPPCRHAPRRWRLLTEPSIWCLAFVCGFFSVGCRSTHSQNELTADAKSSVSANKSDDKTPRPNRVKAHAHYAAGVVHEVNEESDAALEEYFLAAVYDPENESLALEVSRRLAQKKQPERALEVLTRAASRPQASGAVYAHLGFIYSQLGKHDQAVAANRNAIKKSPGSFAGYQNLYLNYMQNRQPEEALKVLAEASRQPNVDAEFLIKLSELYANFAIQNPARKESVNAQALTLLQRADALKPPSQSLRLRLADGFNLLGDTAKAAQIYLDLLKRFAEVPVVRERIRGKLTDLYLRGADRKGAIEQLESMIKDEPTNAQAYYTLGSLYYDGGKWAEAAEHFSKTILLSPNFEQAYYDLASAQISMDKTSDALASLDKARRRFSASFVLEFLTGMAFTRQKGYVEAVQHFTAAEVIAQATEPKRLTHLFYFQLGSTYERKGDYEQAEKYFEKCLELMPDFAEACNYLGYMWAERGVNLERAKELIEKALKAEPNNAAYLDSLGWVLFKLNHPEKALPQILKAVELSEEPDPTVFDHLGDIYAALKQSEKALEAWRKSLSLETNEQVKKKVESAEQK